MTKETLHNRENIKRIILLSIFLLICAWLFWPLSEKEMQPYAKTEMEWCLFEDKVDPNLFHGPFIKTENGKIVFEWRHINDQDTLVVGVRVSRFRFFNLIPSGEGSLSGHTWKEVYDTDTNYVRF